MKKLYLTLITLLTLSTFSYAQDYDLNNYKYRYQKFKGLTFNPSFSSNSNHQFDNLDNPNSVSVNDFYNSNTSNGGLNLNVRYFDVVNTDALQQETSIYAFNNASWSWNKNLNSEDSWYNNKTISADNDNGIQYTKISRRYSENNRFKLRNLNITGGSYLSLYKRETNYNQAHFQNDKNQSVSGSISYSIGRGIGRLDIVTDAVLAHFILEDLRSKKGTTYTNDQLERLAQGITNIRSRRYLDGRFRVRDQLIMLDSILTDNNLHSIKDISYFTTINDNWNYATNLTRRSGRRWTYYVTPGLFLNGQREKNLNKFNYGDTTFIDDYNFQYLNNQTVSTAGTIEYFKSVQKSFKVERSFTASLSLGNLLTSTFGRDSFSNVDFKKPERGSDPQFDNTLQANLSANWQHLYQPNSRTYFIAGINPSVLFRDLRNSDTLTENWSYTNNQISPQLSLFINYYKWINQNLAFRVRANTSVSAGRFNNGPDIWNLRTNLNRVNLRHSISAGITYQLY